MNNERGEFPDQVINANKKVIEKCRMFNILETPNIIMTSSEFLLHELPVEQRITALIQRGFAYKHLQLPQRQYARAELDFREALELSRMLNDTEGQLIASRELMDLYRTGNIDEHFGKQMPKALEAREEVMQIFLDHPTENLMALSHAFEYLALFELEDWENHEPDNEISLIFQDAASLIKARISQEQTLKLMEFMKGCLHFQDNKE